MDPTSPPERPEGRATSRVRRIVDDRRSTNRDDDDSDVADADKVAGPSIEISGARALRNYIACPPRAPGASERPSLGVTLPYLYLSVRVPSRGEFAFEVAVMDDSQSVRRFRASTDQSATEIKPDVCSVPLVLESQPRRLKRDSVLLPRKRQRVDDSSNSNEQRNDASYYGPSVDGNSCDDTSDDDEIGALPCWNRLCVPLAEYTRRAYGTGYVETMRVQIHSNCELKRVYFAEKQVDEDDELPEEFRLYHSPV